MTSLGERLDSIHLRVRVPGTDISAELRNRTDVSVSFGPDVYPWLNERYLERYLATGARLLYTAWVREYRAALNDSFLDASYASEQHDRDFLAARDAIEVQGTSSDQRIAVSAVGMQDIRVRIADGTIRALNEQEFVASAKEAVDALLQDYLAKVRELKIRFFT